MIDQRDDTKDDVSFKSTIKKRVEEKIQFSSLSSINEELNALIDDFAIKRNLYFD